MTKRAGAVATCAAGGMGLARARSSAGTGHLVLADLRAPTFSSRWPRFVHVVGGIDPAPELLAIHGSANTRMR